MEGFKKQNIEIFLRKLKPTSLARAISFGKPTVMEFFHNLRSVYQKNIFELHKIWNMDETSVTSVHVPPKVFARKGAKQVGQTTSAEHGPLVTVCTAVNALRTFTLPLMLVFLQVNFRPIMLTGAPHGLIGRANPSD